MGGGETECRIPSLEILCKGTPKNALKQNKY
jgi:hypothetical protein